MDMQKIMENLRRRGFTPHYFETAKEASDYLNGELDHKVIGFGGSVTLEQMGLYDSLSQHNEVLWHWKDKTLDRCQVGVRAEVYITSCNGMSEEGELVNIDGTGNRVAATLYGPKHVVFVVGVNKIAPDLSSAIDRAKNIASPLNAQRLHTKTPCAAGEESRCFDCMSPERICNALVVYMRKMGGADKAEVILVNEKLGY